MGSKKKWNATRWHLRKRGVNWNKLPRLHLKKGIFLYSTLFFGAYEWKEKNRKKRDRDIKNK